MMKSNANGSSSNNNNNNNYNDIMDIMDDTDDDDDEKTLKMTQYGFSPELSNGALGNESDDEDEREFSSPENSKQKKTTAKRVKRTAKRVVVVVQQQQQQQQDATPTTFKRPMGASPKGCEWDKTRGVWGKKQTTPNEAETATELCETKELKDSLLKLGSAVYAPFPGKKPLSEKYYWGTVLRIRQDPKEGLVYAIQFHDGDRTEKDIPSQHLHRMEEVVKLSKQPMERHVVLRVQPPASYRRLWNTTRDGSPPLDAFAAPVNGENDDDDDDDDDAAPSPTKSAAVVGEHRNPTGNETSNDKGLTLYQLHAQKCGSCSQCRERKDCGSCVVCITACHPKNPRICVQKMCEKIEATKKCQNCKQLPPDWYFYFEKESINPDHRGLVMIGKSKVKKWKSFENLQRSAWKQFQGYGAMDFYRHVGLLQVDNRKNPPSEAASSTSTTGTAGTSDDTVIRAPLPEPVARLAAPHEEQNGPWNLQQIHAGRCGRCQKCNRKPCCYCNTCRHASYRERQQIGCYQMMCDKIPDRYKKQVSPHLPEGWWFYFSSQPIHNAAVDLCGLIIESPTGKRFSSVENAMRRYPAGFASFPDAPRKLYKDLGFRLRQEQLQKLERLKQPPPPPQEPAHNDRPNKRKLEIDSDDDDDEDNDVDNPSVIVGETAMVTPTDSLWLKALYQGRCRSCEICSRENCGKCASCTSNRERSRRQPEACLRNICSKYSITERKQHPEGFPPGWSFYFGAELPGYEHEDLRGLVIIPPSNEQTFASAEKALIHCAFDAAEIQQRSQKFYTQIGAKLLAPRPQHPLTDRPFWREWIRVDGSLACLTGRITNISEDMVNQEEKFTVTFEAQTLRIVNDSSHGKLHVSASSVIDRDEAWDGCLHPSLGAPSPELISSMEFHTKWLTPRIYSRKMVPAVAPIISGFAELPRLEITHKGYILTLAVRKSTIADAGFGVFLSVLPMINSHGAIDEFTLNAGELLDIGVYAPFRTEDYRDDHEHLLKSIIHSSKNEVYSYECREKECYLDITDNMTGQLHSIARQHVPPFVNEVENHELDVPCVHSKIDPEGALHYLLGHTSQEHGDFSLVADGHEIEIFIDYGPTYEKVRLREGYPRKKMSEFDRQRLLQKEEQEYVDELDTFTANEVHSSLKVFRPLILSSGRQPSKSMVLRCIAVSILMKRRAASLSDEFRDVGDDESICDCGVRTHNLDGLVKSCEKMVIEACNVWRGWYGCLSDFKEDAIQSYLFKYMFSKVYPLQLPTESVTPDDFRDLIFSVPT